MAKHALLRPFSHRQFCRFAIVTRSRTGSNLLLSLLRSHPNVWAEGEIFRRLNDRPFEPGLRRLFSRQPFYVAAAGFKIFYYHPLDAQACRLWERLTDMPELKIIHLTRQNLLRVAVSRELARQSGRWASYRDAEPVMKKAVRFEPQQLEDVFEQTQTWIAQTNSRFAHHDMLTVTYEDLTSTTNAALARITRFLGVAPIAASSTLKRQNPESLQELIENYDELKTRFADTQWSHFWRS